MPWIIHLFSCVPKNMLSSCPFSYFPIGKGQLLNDFGRSELSEYHLPSHQNGSAGLITSPWLSLLHVLYVFMLQIQRSRPVNWDPQGHDDIEVELVFSCHNYQHPFILALRSLLVPALDEDYCVGKLKGALWDLAWSLAQFLVSLSS